MYEKIRKWYRTGLWTADMVRDAFDKKIIAADEVVKILD